PRTDLPDDHVDPLLSFSELFLTMDPKALLGGKISIRKLTIIHPFFHLVLQRDGSSNFSAFLTRLRGQKQAPTIGRLFSNLLQFASAADITINNGQLLVDDEKTGRHHKLDKIEVRLPAGTVAVQGRNQHPFPADRSPEISAVINGNPVSFVGQEIVTPEGPTLDLRLQLNNTDLLPYAPYLPAAFGYRLLAGRGDLQLDCLLPRQGVSIGSIQLSVILKLSGLRLQDTASTEIAIGSLGLSARYLAANRQIIVKELKIDAPSFAVTRKADGTWSFPGKKLLAELGQQKSADHPWRVDE
ncbi:MAG: DUF748 domain-containing protein, partial [Deltaproteobacteria bacterium]